MRKVPKFKSRSLFFSLWRDQDPRVAQGPIGPQECSSQTASAVFAQWSQVEPHDRLTNWRTDTAHIGSNRLHLAHCMHSMQLNNTNDDVGHSLQPYRYWQWLLSQFLFIVLYLNVMYIAAIKTVTVTCFYAFNCVFYFESATSKLNCTVSQKTLHFVIGSNFVKF